MLKFRILKSTDSDELSRDVDQYLTEGWTLGGFLQITSRESTIMYIQPMIREE
jgi:hypothetical protein